MTRKLAFLSSLFMLLFLLYASFGPVEVKSADFPVQNLDTGARYQTIQSAIDAPQTSDGHRIRVDAGVHNESATITKGVSLMGEDKETTVINGRLFLDHSDISISEFTLRTEYKAAIEIRADRCTISGNIIEGVGGSDGIDNVGPGAPPQRFSADYTNISGNIIRHIGGSGIDLRGVEHCTIKGNWILDNISGIHMSDSSYCTIAENVIANHTSYGLHFGRGLVEELHDIHIFHNDFLNNARQVRIVIGALFWDNGSEGNYWDDYEGVGDIPYVIDSKNQDNFPLTEPLIIPEFSSAFILPLFFIVTLLVVIVHACIIKDHN